MFGCLCIPNFSVQAAIRHEGLAFGKKPIAILDGPESHVKVCAVNQAACRCGIQVGMSKLQAEACAEIILRRRLVSQEESAQAALLDCAYSVSPQVESTAPGAVTMDLAGTARLLGAAEEIGETLLQRVCACDFEAHIGIAANADSALHAARGFAGLSVIASGSEAAYLADLPMHVLHPPEELRDVLESWGIYTLGALAALPPIPLVERLGQEGLFLQRLARGEIRREMVLAEPPPLFEESMELEEPVELLEPLAFVLNRLLEQLTTRLKYRALATDAVRIVLGLERPVDRQLDTESSGILRETYTRVLKLPVPTQDTAMLLKLVQLELSAHSPKAPVIKVTITAEPARLRHTQAGLFQPLAPEPVRLEITIARLKAIVGDQDSQGRALVGMPSPVNSHRPDDFEVLPFRANALLHRQPPLQFPHFALRIFRPPLPARVETNQEIPQAVIFRGDKVKVLRASGPWRRSSEWWSKTERWSREEWDVAFGGERISGLYRIYRDGLSGDWFVEGMYD